jgi:hypothetical protein
MNLNSTFLIELSKEESLSVEGGHNGTAYRVGKSIHDVIMLFGEVAKEIAIGLLVKKL